MKVGDLVICANLATGEKKIGFIAYKSPKMKLYRVHFADPDWDGGYWTESNIKLLKEIKCT